jgi:glycosyltransferase involved in cell wall biosynthesis
MRILFLHQNFPGQFHHVAQALAASGAHHPLALIPTDNQRPQSIPVRRYPWRAVQHVRRSGLASHYVDCAGRGAVVADALLTLKSEGYEPDLVVGHGGWGETLFVRDVWPDVPILLHAEFFHRGEGLDVGFDPETADPDPAHSARLARARSVVMLQALTDATRGVAPTRWQRDTFPMPLRQKIDVIHEGVDIDLVRPDVSASLSLRRDAVPLRPGDEIVTYVARNLEHYRGFHIFMRALPAILGARSQARVVIVGGDEVSYGPRPSRGTTWRQILLQELAGRLDVNRVHFVGRVPHARFVELMQVSAAHVYLTYPFVLSWSMLEAMSAGALVIGSRTAPVEEVITDGHNGMLRDFFDVRV